jgi:hypothetical protein
LSIEKPCYHIIVWEDQLRIVLWNDIDPLRADTVFRFNKKKTMWSFAKDLKMFLIKYFGAENVILTKSFEDC